MAFHLNRGQTALADVF